MQGMTRQFDLSLVTCTDVNFITPQILLMEKTKVEQDGRGARERDPVIRQNQVRGP
jgi:hypothetical protein